jgi:membrane protein YdbS with pleckstrin-like domain
MGCLALLAFWFLMIGVFVPIVVWCIGRWPHIPLYSGQIGIILTLLIFGLRLMARANTRWREEANEREFAKARARSKHV